MEGRGVGRDNDVQRGKVVSCTSPTTPFGIFGVVKATKSVQSTGVLRSLGMMQTRLVHHGACFSFLGVLQFDFASVFTLPMAP